jgi:hypothetical protein
VDRVVLQWDQYHATDYAVRVSENGSDWTTVYRTAAGDGSTDEIEIRAMAARYVRVDSIAWSSDDDRCWLIAFEVYGPADAQPSATPEPDEAPPSTPAQAARSSPKRWTIMAYIVGDNDLESYVYRDIETELSHSTGDINVVAIADRHPRYDRQRGNWTQTLLFDCLPGITATVESAVADWGERNMGDPQTLIDFVEWAKINYPAQRYVLILWNHGWAWRPGQSMWDDTDADALDPHEIASAMDTLELDLHPLDVVAFDACEQMAIENVVLWSNYALAAAGSEDDTGMNAIEYEEVLPALRADPDMSADELAIRLGTSIHDYTASAATLGTATDDLIVAVDQLALAPMEALPAHRPEIAAAASRAFGMSDQTNKDLHDAAYEIVQTVSDPTVQVRAQTVMDAVDAAVLHSHFVDPRGWWGYEGNVFGISIWWPTTERELDEPSSPEWNDFKYYRTHLEFAQVTHWDEFLAAFLRPHRAFLPLVVR